MLISIGNFNREHECRNNNHINCERTLVEAYCLDGHESEHPEIAFRKTLISEKANRKCIAPRGPFPTYVANFVTGTLAENISEKYTKKSYTLRMYFAVVSIKESDHYRSSKKSLIIKLNTLIILDN